MLRQFGFRWVLLIAMFCSAVAPASLLARDSSVEVNILILVDESYFIEEPKGCRFDVQGQTGIFLRFNNEEGKKRGSLGLARGEAISIGQGSDKHRTVCAFARTATVTTTENVSLVLHGTELTTIAPATIGQNQFLMLEVNEDGVTRAELMTRTAVESLGVTMPRSSRTSNARANTSETGSRPSTTMSVPTPTPNANSLGQGRQPDGTYKIVGFLELYDRNVVYRNGECRGQYGYSDIDEGKQIVFRDGDGNVLGVGYLMTLNASVHGRQCVYGFEAVVSESRFYVFTAGANRGELIYTHAELEYMDWIIWLTLGDD